jgi:mannose-1-phosphate guanylyltransferase/mannose-6-phosphate isomerase
MTQIQPVILAGGSGSRLWPLSRKLYPKQLLNLTGELSLLQNTLLRACDLPDVLPPIVVVGEPHRHVTLAQIDELGDAVQAKEMSVLLEPAGRNTAPAVAGVAQFCRQRGDDDGVMLLVLPADHVISKPEAFSRVVEKAVALAAKGAVVTFGIRPTAPETGYGYIEQGEDSSILSFKEKPDEETAAHYLQQGNFLWNSGMFAFTIGTILTELEHYAPEILSAMGQAVVRGGHDGRFFRFDAESMAESPEDSIDYALMEKTQNAAVVPASIGWSDIGSWKALWDVREKDENGNVTSGDVILEGVKNCIIESHKHLVAAVGLEDTLVIETDDAVMVAPMSHAQDVKKVVNILKKAKRSEYNVHTTVYRPWGSYTVLEIQPRFQIKRITVTPGARLSLQKHHHRNEHWVVVSGTARITNGESVKLVYENEAAYIPAGNVHRLENPGVIPLELIETQLGSYLGEDDIVRFEDAYGRVGEN